MGIEMKETGDNRDCYLFLDVTLRIGCLGFEILREQRDGIFNGLEVRNECTWCV
jgi:hypothetical protein